MSAPHDTPLRALPTRELWRRLKEVVLGLDRLKNGLEHRYQQFWEHTRQRIWQTLPGIIDVDTDTAEDKAAHKDRWIAARLNESPLTAEKNEIVGELLRRGRSRQAIDEYCMRVLENKRKADLLEAMDTSAAQQAEKADSPELTAARRGPPPKTDSHRAVADIVHSFGINWKEHLEKIAKKLDKDKKKTPPSKAWAKRHPPARSWTRAVEYYQALVVQVLEYSLKMAARDTARKLSELSENPH